MSSGPNHTSCWDDACGFCEKDSQESYKRSGCRACGDRNHGENGLFTLYCYIHIVIHNQGINVPCILCNHFFSSLIAVFTVLFNLLGEQRRCGSEVCFPQH